MLAPDRFIAWCKQEQAGLQQQLELLEARKVLTGEDRGSGWVDTTAESKRRAKERLAELESLLTEAGSATVSKPANESILPHATNKPDTTIKKVEAGSSPRGEMGRGDSRSLVHSLHDIAPGGGVVMSLGRGKIAVWKGDDGTPHAVSASCTHKGCIVTWNNADRTWDCPCHGSIFSADGSVIHGPAVDSLQPGKLPPNWLR